MLADLQAEVDRIQQQVFAGQLPSVLANVFQTWVDVAQDLAASHEREARRGFDVLTALRRIPDNLRASVANWRGQHLPSAAASG